MTAVLTIRKCDACGVEDSQAHHVQSCDVVHPISGDLVDFGVSRHIHCCAAAGCGVCATDLEFAGQRGVDVTTASDELSAVMRSKSLEHHQALAERHGISTPEFLVDHDGSVTAKFDSEDTARAAIAARQLESQAMAALVVVEADDYLTASSGGTAYTNPTTPIQCALTTTSPTGTSAGTEVTGGSYARQTITFAAASAGSQSSSATLTFSSMPSCTVTSVNEWDSAGTPIRRWFGDLASSKTVNSGDTFTIASGSYTKTLS